MKGTGAPGALAKLSKQTGSAKRRARQAGASSSKTRVASYNKPSIKSSRPHTGQGVTFHFSHSYVSKKPGFQSKGNHGTAQTTASAHQLYIEREEAVDEIEVVTGGAESISPSISPGDDTQLVSFGNIGDTQKQRVDFWKKVEDAEAKNGRVQCRLIAEIPHELNGIERKNLVTDFAKELDKKGFPWWAVVHAPTERNDERNFHLHLVYYDRPSENQDDNGAKKWDFELTEAKKYRNGVTKITRPHKQKKDRTAQGRNWIKHLRESYALAANHHLALAKKEKRYDPRSYQEAGVPKAATQHLGPKAFSLEHSGLDTTEGLRNAKREAFFRASGWNPDIFEDFLQSERYILAIEQSAGGQAKNKEQLDRSISLRNSILNHHMEKKREASLLLQLEALTERVNKRDAYLQKSISKEERKKTIPQARKQENIDIAATERNYINVAKAEMQEDIDQLHKKLNKTKRRQTHLDQQIEQGFKWLHDNFSETPLYSMKSTTPKQMIDRRRKPIRPSFLTDEKDINDFIFNMEPGTPFIGYTMPPTNNNIDQQRRLIRKEALEKKMETINTRSHARKAESDIFAREFIERDLIIRTQEEREKRQKSAGKDPDNMDR